MNVYRHGLIALGLLSLVLPATLRAEGRPGGKDYYQPDQVRSFSRTATLRTGTPVAVTILALHRHRDAVQHVFDYAFQKLEQVAAFYNVHDAQSDIARLNTQGGQMPVRVSPETIRLLQLAKRAAHLTGGAFDLVSSADGKMRDIKINKGQQTVQFTHAGLRIDVTPVLEGFLADQLMQTIWNANVDNAMVEVGNTSRSVGNNVVGPWRRVVADMVSQYAGRGVAISFSNASTATVAIGAKTPRAEQRLAAGPVREQVRSTTVITKDAAMAAAFANAIYALDPEAGLALANRLPNVHALIRDGGGNLRKTPGL